MKLTGKSDGANGVVVRNLFDKKADFLIPDYQRPYSWTEKECQTLWDDISEFAFPDRGGKPFDKNNEYFLGSIVICNTKRGKKEVIDGQQRLTTLVLLLRAFYECLKNASTQDDIDTKKMISQCIWQSKDELGNEPDFSKPKIKSVSATDEDIKEFEEILKSGKAKKESESKYALNYSFFMSQIKDFNNTDSKNYISDPISRFPYRVMQNCFLLPIESAEEETALMIFSTLNDRGLPLSDTDIFKAQFYKNCTSKPDFIKLWKELEKQCKDMFHVKSGNPMDELFTRYMYYKRAEDKNRKNTNTTESLRKFYGKDKYKILKQKTTLQDLKDLADFWEKVLRQDENFFSKEVLRWLFVLNYAPNSMWTSFVSVYFMANKDETELFRGEEFSSFLKKTVAIIWVYAITKHTLNSLRTPLFREMRNMVDHKDVSFNNEEFSEKTIREYLNEECYFKNSRPITKSILAWWAMQYKKQGTIPELKKEFQIEHIYSTNKAKTDKIPESIRESLGNKSFLESRINEKIRDDRFPDKKIIYTDKSAGTEIKELFELAKSHDNFARKEIEARNESIANTFIDFLKKNGLNIKK